MPNPRKREVHTAILQAKDMLERNADPCETFEGVLSKGYVRALRVLVVLGERFLVKGTSAPRRAI
jgi:hypothetical protein